MEKIQLSLASGVSKLGAFYDDGDYYDDDLVQSWLIWVSGHLDQHELIEVEGATLVLVEHVKERLG